MATCQILEFKEIFNQEIKFPPPDFPGRELIKCFVIRYVKSGIFGKKTKTAKVYRICNATDNWRWLGGFRDGDFLPRYLSVACHNEELLKETMNENT